MKVKSQKVKQAKPKVPAPAKKKPKISPEEEALRAAKKAANVARAHQEQRDAAARRRVEKEAVLARLQATFPLVFVPTWPLPLAVGCHADVAAALPDLSGARVGAWLHWWTTRKAYLHALKAPGSRRYSLTGEAAQGDAGMITDAHRNAARERLKASIAGQAQKRPPKPEQRQAA